MSLYNYCLHWGLLISFITLFHQIDILWSFLVCKMKCIIQRVYRYTLRSASNLGWVWASKTLCFFSKNLSPLTEFLNRLIILTGDTSGIFGCYNPHQNHKLSMICLGGLTNNRPCLCRSSGNWQKRMSKRECDKIRRQERVIKKKYRGGRGPCRFRPDIGKAFMSFDESRTWT